MRAAINSAAAIAKGKYLMKCDAHCMFAEGYDEILKADCDDNWVVIPRRYSLDAENWCIEQNGKPPRDYHYLCYPDPEKGADKGMHGVEWWNRCRERTDPQYDIDDEMSSQGSCWFMTAVHFNNFLHGLNEYGYGSFAQEFQQIGNSTWLGGGAVKINKKVFYCHLHKGRKYGRMYPQSRSELITHINWSADYWMGNQWKGRKHDFEWLIDKFAPVPTWPENWKGY
jgi:glycosyltransferase involved in cell wall biosynthesis